MNQKTEVPAEQPPPTKPAQQSTPSQGGTPGAKVRHPPGGKSSGPLW